MIFCFSRGTPIPVSATVKCRMQSSTLSCLQLNLQRHLTFMCKFYGVAYQVDDDLVQPAGIAVHNPRHLGGNLA